MLARLDGHFIHIEGFLVSDYTHRAVRWSLIDPGIKEVSDPANSYSWCPRCGTRHGVYGHNTSRQCSNCGLYTASWGNGLYAGDAPNLAEFLTAVETYKSLERG